MDDPEALLREQGKARPVETKRQREEDLRRQRDLEEPARRQSKIQEDADVLPTQPPLLDVSVPKRASEKEILSSGLICWLLGAGIFFFSEPKVRSWRLDIVFEGSFYN
jgi:hypothetical protein